MRPLSQHVKTKLDQIMSLSDGFASDPFKGSDPFVADILYQEPNVSAVEGAGNAGDEVDTSLSCAENKASTGTQCFESEFPDEDSDIEISYSREDLDTIGNSHGFKPIQSSSDELGPDPQQGWRSQGQYSVESDPNGYELDLHAPTPPSDIEEQSLGSLADETTLQPPGELKQGNSVSVFLRNFASASLFTQNDLLLSNK